MGLRHILGDSGVRRNAPARHRVSPRLAQCRAGADHQSLRSDVPLDSNYLLPRTGLGNAELADGSDRNLERVNEPSLLAVAGSDVEAYRCLGRPTFNRSAVVRAIARPGARPVLIAKHTTSGFELDLGPNVRERAVPLDKEAWRKLQRLVVSVGFWSRPLSELEFRAADPTTLVVEGVRMGRYHVVASHSPDPGHPDRVVCDYLFSLAGDWP